MDGSITSPYLRASKQQMSIYKTYVVLQNFKFVSFKSRATVE